MCRRSCGNCKRLQNIPNHIHTSPDRTKYQPDMVDLITHHTRTPQTQQEYNFTFSATCETYHPPFERLTLVTQDDKKKQIQNLLSTSKTSPTPLLSFHFDSVLEKQNFGPPPCRSIQKKSSRFVEPACNDANDNESLRILSRLECQ